MLFPDISNMILLLMIGLFLWGGANLLIPDFAWKLHKLRMQVMGVDPKRTKAWERSNAFTAVFMMIVAVLVAIYAIAERM